MRSSLTIAIVLVAALSAVGCSQMGPSTAPTAPTSSSSVAPSVTSPSVMSGVAALKPGYEPAFYNGSTVTINAIEVRQNAGPLAHAAADFYETVYPPNKALWPDTPQCNPCDHEGNGIDFTDFHNHVLDSIPSSPGGGEFNPLWHVFVILPKDFSPAGQAAYAARLPMKSEAAIDAAIAAGVAVEVDTGFYFLCAVVNAHAAP
jgi:hypothetical protein